MCLPPVKRKRGVRCGMPKSEACEPSASIVVYITDCDCAFALTASIGSRSTKPSRLFSCHGKSRYSFHQRSARKRMHPALHRATAATRGTGSPLRTTYNVDGAIFPFKPSNILLCCSEINLTARHGVSIKLTVEVCSIHSDRLAVVCRVLVLALHCCDYSTAQ